MNRPPDPPARFEAPWHAQVFALAVALNESGHFTWPEWAGLFATCLQDQRRHGPIQGSDDYYIAWVTALERMITRKNIADPPLLAEMKQLWTEAFLNTPHGKPVHPEKPARLR